MNSRLPRVAIAALFACWAGPVCAQKTLFSGPQSGERIENFNVLAVNGPDAGKEVDYVASYGNAPTLVIFLHQLDRNIASLLSPTEKFARERASAGLRCLIVYLAPDKIEGERRMRAVINSLKLEVPVAISLDGIEGPGAWGLNREAAVTILVAKDRTVTDNFAIVQAGTVDAPRVMAAVARHVGGHVPTLEEIQAERARMSARPGASRAGGMTQPDSGGQSGGKTQEPDPPEMVALLRSLIQPSNTPERVDDVVKELEGWAGSDAKRRDILARKLGVIIPLKYGTEYARTKMVELQTSMSK
jgi:hypothetical protein